MFIGVHDKTCKLSGLKVTDELLKNIAAIRSDGNILPQPAMTVHNYTFDDGDVVVVETLPAHFPPVRYKGTIWVRIGPRRGIANEMEERLLIEKRTSNAKTFDEQPCVGATIDDLNIPLFKMVYLPKAVNSAILANDKRDIKLQLASLRFYDLVYDCPTNAGILIFGNNVRYFFSTAYVQYVKFGGTTLASTVLADTQFSGDLISIINLLDSFIKINIIKKRPVHVSTLIEENIFSYAENAIREFLMNAVMHRSYEITSPIKFYQFSDRIEIVNPGGLYGNARPENFPNVSDYRNLVISESMRVMGFVNRFNRGVAMAQADLTTNGNEPAEFDLNTLGVFGVIIKEKNEPVNDINGSVNDIDGSVNDINGSVNDIDGSVNDINGSVNDIDGSVNISDTEKIFIEIIQKNEKLNIKQISELSNISYRTTARYLKSLKERGLIKYVGADKTGGYILSLHTPPKP
ncbi:hypothetical protein FACS1894201_09870 [Bacteroidia bacterium]|nr:hypothetical protein FACS1894201_09870 [Bacteroidia bacterium]